uniref:Glucokinase-1 n=1 Tax=Kluyveromyces lactis TaxID=28985 RepID=UPI003CE5C995
MSDPKLTKAVDSICDQFIVTKSKISQLTEYFIDCMEKGLEPCESDISQNKGLPMIPTFVTDKPSGQEHGVTMLAADLGGTNFRVCSVELLGNHEFKIEQEKSKIPTFFFQDDHHVTSKDLFQHMALITHQFLTKHHKDVIQDYKWKMGFTFSYPVDQTSLSSGKLIRWTKGFKIGDTVGQDVVQLFQQELNDIGLSNVHVVALTNDTTGTLLARCYASSDAARAINEPVIGCIFGTGTNGCYMEKLENIHKLDPASREELLSQGKTHMCINTEWGSFDNELNHLPTTSYDIKIDQQFSTNPGFQLFEKRVSGLYLGEILRNILLDLEKQELFDLKESVLKNNPFILTTETLSHIEIDTVENDLQDTRDALLKAADLETTFEERVLIQKLVRAISRRAAFLAAVPIAAILIKTNALNQSYHCQVEVGCDGSVVEHYPGFRSMMRHALALSPIGPEGERDVHLRISKDGSGVGAALCALHANY